MHEIVGARIGQECGRVTVDGHVDHVVPLAMGGPDRDWKVLLVEIAKSNPASVVKANDAIKGSGWATVARQLLKEDKKIAAIKYCRR
jgi:hypothetical protein